MKRRHEWGGAISKIMSLSNAGPAEVESAQTAIIPHTLLEKYPAPRTVTRFFGTFTAWIPGAVTAEQKFAGAWGLIKTLEQLPPDDLPFASEDVGAVSWMHWQPFTLAKAGGDTAYRSSSFITIPFDIKQKRKFMEGEELRFELSSSPEDSTPIIAWAFHVRFLILL